MVAVDQVMTIFVRVVSLCFIFLEMIRPQLKMPNSDLSTHKELDEKISSFLVLKRGLIRYNGEMDNWRDKRP